MILRGFIKKMTEDEEFDFYQNDVVDYSKIDKSKIVRKPQIDVDKSTVQISIKFDYKLLEKVRLEAELKAVPYQTFLKDIIRDYFEEESFKKELKNITKRLKTIEQKLEINQIT